MLNAKKKTFFAISFIIFLVVIFHYLGFLRPIENFLRNIIVPGSKAMYTWSFLFDEDEIDKINDLEILEEKYRQLEEDFLQSQVDSAQFKILQEENVELREQLNFFETMSSYRHLGAEVVGENIDPVGSTIIIDRGMADGIEEGDPVIVASGVMVGRILKIEQNTSLVRLLNDTQSKVVATILNNDRSIGLVEGGYGISIRLNFIPQNEKVSVGDMIVTSGLEDGVPKGLLLGKVEVVEKEAYEPFQRAVLSPIVNLNKINLVSVITKIEK